MKVRKMSTFNSLGRDEIRVATSFLIEGIALMLFRGLKTLRFLSTLRFWLAWNEKNKLKISKPLRINLKKILPRYNNNEIYNIPSIS